MRREVKNGTNVYIAKDDDTSVYHYSLTIKTPDGSKSDKQYEYKLYLERCLDIHGDPVATYMQTGTIYVYLNGYQDSKWLLDCWSQTCMGTLLKRTRLAMRIQMIWNGIATEILLSLRSVRCTTQRFRRQLKAHIILQTFHLTLQLCKIQNGNWFTTELVS